MRTSEFSESQIAFVLRQGEEGMRQLWRSAGKTAISHVTSYNWKKKYGGLFADRAVRTNLVVVSPDIVRALFRAPRDLAVATCSLRRSTTSRQVDKTARQVRCGQIGAYDPGSDDKIQSRQR